MDKKTRNILIVVAVVIVALCCCAATVVASVWFAVRVERGQTDIKFFDFEFDPDVQAETEQTFTVGKEPYLDIGNFAGKVNIRAGEDGTIRVVATKKALGTSSLDRISVDMREEGDGVVIRTTKHNNLNNASVDLEIVAPPNTELRLNTGAGSIEIQNMIGSIDAHSGAGTITVTGARGPVRLGTGAGTVYYRGAPVGRCRFETGAGEISIRLPAEPNVRLDLNTGLGSIDVGYDVVGQTSQRDVSGVVGDGSEASIYAGTGLGSISVRP